MASKTTALYWQLLERLDTKPKLKRAVTALGVVLIAYLSAYWPYSLLAKYPPGHVSQYLGIVLLTLVPVMVAMCFKIGAIRYWYRIPTVAFIWFTTSPVMLAVMMMACISWLWWRLLVTDQTPWRFALGNKKG